MGVTYILVNQTKRETVAYDHVRASKKRELAGNGAASAITTWYLLENLGDRISFVSDEDRGWPFPAGSRAELASYVDVTQRIVEDLLRNQILEDRGYAFVDPDEPGTVYERDLRNIWERDEPS